MRTAAVALLAVFALVSPAAPLRAQDDKDPARKLKRPALELRVNPRYGFSPLNAYFVAELKGGDDLEQLYCPEVEWEWGDGGKSVEEADCDPWTPNSTIERRFSNHHLYPFAGLYLVKVTLRKTGKTLTTQSVQVTVRAGLGDVSPDPGN